MSTLRALDLPLDADLSTFSRLLWQHGIGHRVFEERGRQILEVAEAAYLEPVRSAWERFERGDAALIQALSSEPPSARNSALKVALRGAPVTAMALVLMVLGALLVHFDRHLVWVPELSFNRFRIDGTQMWLEPAGQSWSRGEYWRLLTPIFLHFGAMHTVFNGLWLLEFGRHIERRHGSLTLLALVVIIGAGGNIAQYVFEHASLFGGMSGVIYGLLGYIACWNRFASWQRIPLHNGVLVFMLLWLVACLTGVVEALGFGAIANAAHVGGLVMGALLGSASALLGIRRPAE